MKERESKYELLRIVAMAGIITLHYMNMDMGGVSKECVFPNSMYFICKFLECLGVPLVNCFVLISGIFGLERNKFSIKKPLELVIITIWYGAFHYILSLILGINLFSGKGFLQAIFPFFIGKRWFVETYIILYMLSPFINKVIRGISKNAFKCLLMTQLLFFSIWYSFGLSSPLLDEGYGIINFITLYMIGAYIKLYVNCNAIKIDKCFVGWLMAMMFTFLIGLFKNSYGYAFITNIIAAVMICLIFMKLEIPVNKKINYIGKYTFDTYFVHSDFNTSRWLYQDILKSTIYGNSVLIIPHLIVTIIIIYLLGTISGIIRHIIFKKISSKCLCNISMLNIEVDV